MARISDPDLAERRRRQILDAALKCFARDGFHQASMQEICAEAEISAGALYRYFGSKAELIVAIADEDCRAAQAPIEALDGRLSFQERLSEIARICLDRVARKDRALAAEVLAEAVRDRTLAARLAETETPLRRTLAALVRDGQRQGDVDPLVDADQAARVLMDTLDGMALRLIVFGDRDAASALRDFALLFQRFFAPARPAKEHRRALKAAS